MDRIEATDRGGPRELNAAEVGALAHLYRGEVYRSTIWRTRLDNTTNWAVVTMGIALSITFSSKDASPVPLVIVGTLVVIFMIFEARPAIDTSTSGERGLDGWRRSSMRKCLAARA